MLQAYQLHCDCGLSLKIEILPSSPLKLYCERCHKIIFARLCKMDTTPVDETVYATGQIRQEGTKVATVLAEETIAPAPPLVDKSPLMNAKSSTKTLEREKRIGDYHIVKKIGSGGMGDVYLAVHEPSQEKVVIKTLKLVADAISGTEHSKLIDYFLREMQVLRSLHHPNIVQCKGYGNYSGTPYLVMEYLDGKDLDTALSDGPLKLSQAVPIIYHMASALEYAKSKDMVHRDIKPANIMLLAKNECMPKLIDFGLAKSLGEHYYSLTRSGSMLGTPFYMPREQVEDAKHVDHRADIYSLGATFYHMLSGKPPFHEYANRGRLPLIMAITQTKPIPLAKLRPKLPKRLHQIVGKAMEAALHKRYQSATELKQDIKDFLVSIKK